MKKKDNQKALADPGKETASRVEKMQVQEHFAQMNMIFTQLPYKIYLIDPTNYKVLATNCNETEVKSGSILRCHKIRFGLDRPCKLTGLLCPLEVVKKTKMPTKIERSYDDGVGKGSIVQINVYPLFNDSNELECVSLWELDITAHKKLEKELLDKELVIKHLNNELFTTNQTLVTMAKNIEAQRVSAEKRIVDIISSRVLPLVASVQENVRNGGAAEEINLIRMILNDLVQGVSTDKVIISDTLTQTELRIANLIKTGMSSREISDHLYISIETVKTHRKNIRKKLRIRDSGINLWSYIQRKYNDGEINSVGKPKNGA